jgi:putative transposase
MSTYRRYFVPGGTYFFTVVTHERRRFLTQPISRQCLREALKCIRAKRHFEMPAIVLLPDHLHVIWTLPEGDTAYSVRWKRIKEEFTIKYIQAGGEEGPRTNSRLLRKERGIWQRRFWEHTIKDDDDFEQHFNYVHYNPVKHGLVKGPRDWPYSSFHKWVKLGVYQPDWGCLDDGPVTFRNLHESEME